MRLVRGGTGLAAFAVLWHAAVTLGVLPETFVPPPTVVAVRLVELLGQGSFQRAVVATVLAWGVALGVAVGVAVPAGLVLGGAPVVRDATRAVIEMMRPIPSVALIPVALLVVGGGPEAKIALAAYASTWPILLHTVSALDELDRRLLDAARCCGAGRGRIAVSVALPSAAPFVFTGVRLAAAIALIVVVSTEFLAGAGQGIGTTVLTAGVGGGRMDIVLAATLVIGAVALVVDDGLTRLGRRLFAWSPITAESR